MFSFQLIIYQCFIMCPSCHIQICKYTFASTNNAKPYLEHLSLTFSKMLMPHNPFLTHEVCITLVKFRPNTCEVVFRKWLVMLSFTLEANSIILEERCTCDLPLTFTPLDKKGSDWSIFTWHEGLIDRTNECRLHGGQGVLCRVKGCSLFQEAAWSRECVSI